MCHDPLLPSPKTRSKRSPSPGFPILDMAIYRAPRSCHNRSIDSVQVIEDLIKLAKTIRESGKRGEELGLSEEELAFYDAIGTSEEAVEVLGDENLRSIAQELVAAVRKNATVDWTMKNSSLAKMRIVVKRLLRKHGYPPEKQNEAADTVVKQAELLSDIWAPATAEV